MARKIQKKAPKAKPKRIPRAPLSPEVKGSLLLSGCLILLLSLISFSFGEPTSNWIGVVGNQIGWIFHATLGLGSYLFLLYLTWIGGRLFFAQPIPRPFITSFWVMLFISSTCLLLSIIEKESPATASYVRQTLYPSQEAYKWRFHFGGAPFYFLYHDLPSFSLHHILNVVGSAILCLAGMFSSFCALTRISPFFLIEKTQNGLRYFTHLNPLPLFQKRAAPPKESSAGSLKEMLRFVKLQIPNQTNAQGTNTSQAEMLAIQPEPEPKARPSITRKEQSETADQDSKMRKKEPLEEPPPPPKPPEQPKEERRKQALADQRVHNGDFSFYSLPSLSLLSAAKKVDSSLLKKDLKRQAEVLEETLSSFGIEAKVGQINCGPTITSFEVHPAIGVKVQKIKTLENDIALNMEAKSIRIIAPIPGKAAVGIEVPNAIPQEVGFKDMLAAYQQGEKKFHIPILLGKAVNGEYVMSDLAKMPHCIIAGATGSGKSVCINTIVMSILLNARPDEIRLLMVDPKKVELTPYTRLPHMLAPVITEPQGAAAALNWLVKEMEARYEILKLTGVRNIDSFNSRPIDSEFEKTLGKEIPAKFPFIVGIIDELADLMMVSSQDIETPIARIAQMARAVGIHLILATQRPSREVITGLIKANFPTRISFKVASRVNSQIVLDETGAESLLGNGDMLFLPPGSSHLTRAQGAFIRDEDIHAVVKQICSQAPPNYTIDSFDRARDFSDFEGGGGNEPSDRLYEQALDVVLSTGNASTTFLQRKLKVGYARAASLIDELEARGVVGPADGSKARKILVATAGVVKEDSEPFESPLD